MEEHKIDKNFSGRLNILRVGVLGTIVEKVKVSSFTGFLSCQT